MDWVTQESVLFKRVLIVTADESKEGDVLVENGKISKIEPHISAHAELIIDEPGLALFPGVIDTHVHFREPGLEKKETIYSGSKAGVSGGVTSFFEMPNTNPLAVTVATVEAKKKIASETSLSNYNFFIGANKENIEELYKIENVPGIKIFVGSSTGNMLVDTDEHLIPIFKQQSNRLIAIHSEDEAQVRRNAEIYKDSTDVKDFLKIRTVEAAISSTKRMVAMALGHNRRLHVCHLTTQEEAEFLAALPNRGQVTTEVSPQHLFLWAPDIYDKIGTFAQINPPIREKRHADALWKALKSGVIQSIGTDHAPHRISEKENVFGRAPSGMPGIETSLSLLLTQAAAGRCSINEIVKWMCESPASVYKIENKGYLKEGYDADLVLVDLKKKKRIERKDIVSKCGWSAFEGVEITGVPIATFVNGNLVFREGDFFEETKGKEVRIKE
jgi:dihydroorotase